MNPLLLLVASFAGSADAAAVAGDAEAQPLPLPASWRLRAAPEEETETLAFKVLGIDWESERVAFQQIYRIESVYDEGGELVRQPYPCAYSHPELEGSPTAGLTIGVWSLSQDRLEKRYTPFPAASGAEGCVVEERDAMDWLATAGGFPGAGELPGTELGDSLPVSVTTSRFDEENLAHMAGVFGMCHSPFSLEYRVHGWPARRIWTPEQRCMGSDLSVEVENYWTQGGQVLFHEHFRQSDRFAGMSNREAHRFTLLGLPDSQDAPGCDAWAMVSDPDPAGLNVRTEPGTTGQIVDRIPLGTRVHILESKNGWLLLDRGGFAGSSQPERLVIAPGWVHGGLLTNAGSGKLYVYESPESGVGGRQVSSEEVGRVHNCLGTWIEVAVDGQRAWVSAPEL